MPSAERQGFEPWKQLPACRISSAVRSTTPASLLQKSDAKVDTFSESTHDFDEKYSLFFSFSPLQVEKCIIL